MPRRPSRRRAALVLAAAACAAPAAGPAPAHAMTSSFTTTLAPERPQPSPGVRAVAAARDHLGAAYAMGATGPDAFDCSGLTSAAFRAAGVTLPRTSQAQYAVGEPVARDEVRKGDLVFFSTAGPGASHVGIATGRGTAISATSSGGVMEHPTTDAYWGGQYVGARRVRGA